MKRSGVTMIVLALALAIGSACERMNRPDEADGTGDDDVQVDEELGTLRVANTVNEPIAVHMDGQELFIVPPGSSFTFRNLPTRRVTIYGVGQISQKHYGLPQLDIQAGQDYEWTINP